MGWKDEYPNMVTGLETEKWWSAPPAVLRYLVTLVFGCLSVRSRNSAGSLLAILAAGFAVSLCHYVQRLVRRLRAGLARNCALRTRVRLLFPAPNAYPGGEF